MLLVERAKKIEIFKGSELTMLQPMNSKAPGLVEKRKKS
jgi:hypothetical protein